MKIVLIAIINITDGNEIWEQQELFTCSWGVNETSSRRTWVLDTWNTFSTMIMNRKPLFKKIFGFANTRYASELETVEERVEEIFTQ